MAGAAYLIARWSFIRRFSGLYHLLASLALVTVGANGTSAISLPNCFLAPEMSRIFISYRRSDAAAEAGRIYDYLEPYFGRDSIFMDVDALEAGEDFRERLNEVLGQCQVLLAVISKGWLQAKDVAGRRRLDNPADWVRLEVETALTRKIRVIPVLAQGVAMPVVSDLPVGMQPLAYRQAALVRHGNDFRRDMERLQGVLQRHFNELESVRPALNRVRQERVHQRRVHQRTVEKDGGQRLPVAVATAVPQSGAARKVVTGSREWMSRRQVLQALGYSASGLGLVLAGNALLGNTRWRVKPGASDETSNVSSDDAAPSEVPSAPSASVPSDEEMPSDVVSDEGDASDTALPVAEFEVATITDVASGSFETIQKVGEFFSETLADAVTLDLMKIPSGTFVMGSPSQESARQENEGPQREVSVPSFFMGKYPVTQAQWRVVASLPQVNRGLETSPSTFEGDNLPVEQVSWNDAVEFCDRLSANTGKSYRLPSEAEWEYACRAGTTTPFHVGETSTTNLANYRGADSDVGPGAYNGGPTGEYRKTTTEVGRFPANAFGLYDMHGNVHEYCQDYWHSNYEGTPTDGSAWLTNPDNENHVLRGGSWDHIPSGCRSAHRDRNVGDFRANDVGFRIVCDVV